MYLSINCCELRNGTGLEYPSGALRSHFFWWGLCCSIFRFYAVFCWIVYYFFVLVPYICHFLFEVLNVFVCLFISTHVSLIADFCVMNFAHIVQDSTVTYSHSYWHLRSLVCLYCSYNVIYWCDINPKQKAFKCKCLNDGNFNPLHLTKQGTNETIFIT